VILGLTVVSGHNWTLFLNFKGGKGIATGLGVLVGLTIKLASARWAVLGTLIIWTAVFGLSGYVSLASLIAATALPVLMAVTAQSWELVLLGIILCIFVVIRHRPNIKRLLNGQESRVRLLKSKKSFSP